jgi:hypothetical protein
MIGFMPQAATTDTVNTTATIICPAKPDGPTAHITFPLRLMPQSPVQSTPYTIPDGADVEWPKFFL